MDGYWSSLERRTSLIDLFNQRKVDLVVTRDINSLSQWSWVITLPTQQEQEEEVQKEELEGGVIRSTITFKPSNPFIELGEEVHMFMNIENESPNKFFHLRISLENSEGFLVSGPEIVNFKLYPKRSLVFEWTLFPHQVGPERFPGAWLETVNSGELVISSQTLNVQQQSQLQMLQHSQVQSGDVIKAKQRIQSIDSLCLILPCKSKSFHQHGRDESI